MGQEPVSYYTDLALDDIRAALRPKETFLEGAVTEQAQDLAYRRFEEYKKGELPFGSQILVEDGPPGHTVLWEREKNPWRSKWHCAEKSADISWDSLRVRPGFTVVRIGPGSNDAT